MSKKLTKKELEKLHRQNLEANGGPDRGATWVGCRPTVYTDKTTKRNKKLRRNEGKSICRNASYLAA